MSYLNNWHFFYTWLNDKKLNIQLKCLVRFGQDFFKPLMKFFISQDFISQIFDEKN